MKIETRKEFESRFGWWGIVLVVLFFCVLHTYLASKFSLWGDEFDAITPALRPWRGEKNFWWQIRQYIANPPGENLVLRWWYHRESLAWLRAISPEVFWRIPYILVFSATVLVTYFFAQRWSRSVLVGIIAATLLLCSPGPFAWTTETRFYSWAIFFMTCAVWQGISFIESEFEAKEYLKLSAITSVGVCFHVSMALVCYLLFWYALGNIVASLFREYQKTKRIRKKTVLELIRFFWPGFLPYFIFKYAKHHWMFVPGGVGYLKVFGATIIQIFTTTPVAIGTLLPIGTLNAGWVAIFLLIAMASSIAYAIHRKDRTRLFVLSYLAALSFGGVLVVTLSSNSNQFSIMARHYLFSIPVLMAMVLYLLPFEIREWLRNLPSAYSMGAIAVLCFLSIFRGTTMARDNLEHGSPAKVNYDLAEFRDFYRTLPDARRLVLIGVGDGDLWATTDDGGYIGGVHLAYLKEFGPALFLNARQRTDWIVPRQLSERRKFDFLVFGNVTQTLKRVSLKESDFECRSFRWDSLHFCRAK